MQTKSLLSGLIGFFVGGLLVATAATMSGKTGLESASTIDSMSSMTMDDMTEVLRGKTGDAYDKAFISAMIEHHEGAVEMAKQSAQNAKHDEIKILSKNIISAQEKEISQMKQWMLDWGYTSGRMDHEMMDHQ